jgi:hypothetical protein
MHLSPEYLACARVALKLFAAPSVLLMIFRGPGA